MPARPPRLRRPHRLRPGRRVLPRSRDHRTRPHPPPNPTPRPGDVIVPMECRGCHRRLKNPSPTGYGPTCARKRGLTAKPRRTRAIRRSKPAIVPPAPDAIPGQTELPMFYMQATLESL